MMLIAKEKKKNKKMRRRKKKELIKQKQKVFFLDFFFFLLRMSYFVTIRSISLIIIQFKVVKVKQNKTKRFENSVLNSNRV